MLQKPRPCVAPLTRFILVLYGTLEITSHFASEGSSVKLANALCIGHKHRSLPRPSTPVLHPERGTVHLRFCMAQNQLIATVETRQLCLAKAQANVVFPRSVPAKGTTCSRIGYWMLGSRERQCHPSKWLVPSITQS